MSMNVGNSVIASSQHERLLGVHIQQNMKWTEYIRDNRNSLLYGLSQRISGLKMISRYASFKARLTVANGIFRSKLIFMMPLWAGCSKYLIDALQVSQNKAARIVTRHDINISVQQILRECGWRSVRQEMVYHTVLTVHKTIIQKQPRYLYNKLTADGTYPYSTRKASKSTIRQSRSYRTNLEVCRQSFRWRGARLYEEVPSEIRKIEQMGRFKKALDTWIRSNIAV